MDAGGGGSVHPPLLTKGVLPSEAVLRFQVIPLSHHHDDGAHSYAEAWLTITLRKSSSSLPSISTNH